MQGDYRSGYRESIGVGTGTIVVGTGTIVQRVYRSGVVRRDYRSG